MFFLAAGMCCLFYLGTAIFVERSHSSALPLIAPKQLNVDSNFTHNDSLLISLVNLALFLLFYINVKYLRLLS